ncbi:uncharacterized protein DEA37_0007998 [Paragonimus westermani]|uniref:Uncharacterized protein n=1 Tax=Paragonimus westermani TaxID=34504 RepID=A0A5J4N6F5_9TREM|nr:uncharacterized protein DEA37_0007998 [Paragonimus westermani]
MAMRRLSLSRLAVKALGVNPLQRTVSSTHYSVVPLGTDRPIIFVPLRTGYMSLDLRKANHISGYTACDGRSSSVGVHAPSTGFSSAYSSVRLDSQSIGYRMPVQPYPYPLTTNFPMSRFSPYDSHGPTNVQHSYTRRAQPQPPAYLHMNAVRPIPGGGGGVMDNNRSPGFTGTQPPLRSFLRPTDQTIRLLEEREALQLEYERLSERAPWPASNNHLATTCREIQAQQQHQERMARTRLQQQQQDATRANMVGGYAPRMSMQRSPSASPPLPNVPSIIR